MEKKVLFQRIKGLLALVLAFTMMFGTGMMVLADEAKIDFANILRKVTTFLEEQHFIILIGIVET